MASYTIVAKRLDGWRRNLVRKYRPPRRPHCIRRVPSAPRKAHSTPPPLGPCLLWPRSPISATVELLYSNSVTNLRHLTTHSTTVCWPTKWRSYCDARYIWCHFTLCIVKICEAKNRIRFITAMFVRYIGLRGRSVKTRPCLSVVAPNASWKERCPLTVNR